MTGKRAWRSFRGKPARVAQVIMDRQDLAQPVFGQRAEQTRVLRAEAAERQRPTLFRMENPGSIRVIEIA